MRARKYVGSRKMEGGCIYIYIYNWFRIAYSAAQALKCLGFMIYHPSLVTAIAGMAFYV
jgi:hypothetical protein